MMRSLDGSSSTSKGSNLSTMQPQPAAQATTPVVPQILAELSPQQFQAWRHHPVTQLLLQDYLPAWRAARGKELLNAILGGSADVPTQQRVRGEILMAIGIEDISLETLRHFWEVAPPVQRIDLS